MISTGTNILVTTIKEKELMELKTEKEIHGRHKKEKMKGRNGGVIL